MHSTKASARHGVCIRNAWPVPARRAQCIFLASHSASGHSSQQSQAKQNLLRLIKDTGRGSRVGRFQRGPIEEAQVEVELFGGAELDYDLLAGKWKLLYTTAADVLPILAAERTLAPPLPGLPSPVMVGNIYQRFTSPAEGIVENIIQLSVPFFLRDQDGITFTVGARYEVRSPHRIAITFEEARVGDVAISDSFETLLAPALLPRTPLTHMVLLAIKQFQLRFPFRSAQQLAEAAGGPASASYQLTYLDEDMLIGRASQLGGSFIFTRA